MRLEQTPKLDYGLKVNARLITSSTILHLSADELEHALNQEQTENPALEIAEQRVCLFCGAVLYGSTCITCGHLTSAQQYSSSPEVSTPSMGATDLLTQWTRFSSGFDVDNYGFAEVDGEEGIDPLARIPDNETLQEILLHQLETLISPDDAPIAEQLVGNLNDRGYLEASVQEIAQLLHVPVERVEYVLSQLQGLEPLGIGARDVRECLLLQLTALGEQYPPPPLVRTLIEEHFDALGRNQIHDLMRQLKVSEAEIRQAYHYIRTTLHPFPAHIYHTFSSFSRSGNDATYIHPDVIIRTTENGFDVELIEEKRYNFQIGTEYTPASTEASTTPGSGDFADLQRYMHHHQDRARFFVECIYRRWRTLKRVALFVVEYQRAFLEHGLRYLRPLTRAEVANRLDLDEGTVSRATAHKYVLLPNGRLMPFSDFFDGSLGIKDMLRELIQDEDPKHRLSDEELARLLTARGVPLARRTVTKYREEMGIGSSRERSQYC